MAEHFSNENSAVSESLKDVVDILENMFGEVMSRDAIFAIAESCDGNLQNSIEVIMNISNDADPSYSVLSNESQVQDLTSFTNIDTKENNPDDQSLSTCNSYANISKSTGAVPKIKPETPTKSVKMSPTIDKWTDQTKRIINYHNKGHKVLILMRGASGSGKSTLARKIAEMTVGSENNRILDYIFSTDDYFMVRGVYVYRKDCISAAHIWNQTRVKTELKRSRSPIIIDNTNIEMWEMQPYVVEAVKEGYYIELVEPQTPWSYNAHQLLKKSSHNVPLKKIRQMIDNFQPCRSGEELLKFFKLKYPSNKEPPTIRNIPTYNKIEENPINYIENSEKEQKASLLPKQPLNLMLLNVKDTEEQQVFPKNENSLNVEEKKSVLSEIPPVSCDSKETDNTKVQFIKNYASVEKTLDEFEKIDRDWDMSEKWTESEPIVEKPHPQRTTIAETESYSGKILPQISEWNDWRVITSFVPSWDHDAPKPKREIETKFKETRDSSTSIDINDTNFEESSQQYKIIVGYPRDINFYYIPQDEKIPDKRMLDKSCMTNDLLISEAYRSGNEAKHFTAFRKMFKNIPAADLKDIFDRCCGEVNWAVEMVLDGVASNNILTMETDCCSDVEDEQQEQSDCTSSYNIASNFAPSTSNTTSLEVNNLGSSSATVPVQKKPKKDKNVSESSLQLKKHIEQNVVISEAHYSQHCLKIKKIRRGEVDDNPPGTSDCKANEAKDTPCEEKDKVKCENEENSDTSQDIIEPTYNIMLGRDFIVQLDELFGRKDMKYPANIVPLISMPLSTLNEINALWIESLTHQIQSQQQYSDIIIKQDEEFARKLADKETELAREGKEPEVPDLKELMDLELAVNLYLKDVAKWHKNIPNTLAAKLSRDKLYNLFPDISQEILSEVLLAHGNDFRKTVEDLLVSTGHSDIIREENGISKFIMEKELATKAQIFEQVNKELSEEEWPILPPDENIDMLTVDKYREEARIHLEQRNTNHQKATCCINRGMTQVASYYNDVAVGHKRMYEQANTMAAASLIQVNARNGTNTTLDLHHLFVTESIQALDLFIDHHIRLLQEGGIRNKSTDLFFITGRGLHSQGGPKIKPAARKRLTQRGFTKITELNPGLISVEVTARCKFTHEIETDS